MKVCPKCNKSKPNTKRYFHKKSSSKNTFRSICKVCANKAARQSNIRLKEQRLKPLPEWIIQVDRDRIELKHIQRVVPNYPQSKSDYHNQIENINHNPKFFSWLCAGANQNFIP